MRQDDFLLLIDADDTLWESALFFERTEHDFLSIMTTLGFSDDEVRRLVHRRDIERLSVTGYGARPYIDTLRLILHELVPESPPWACKAIDDIEKNLLGHPIILLPGVISTLEKMKNFPVRIIVYTMGEEDHQTDKFIRSGLIKLVDELRIVPVKNVNALRKTLAYTDIDPVNCIIVGNSPRSDINPAIELNMTAVFLQRHRTWAAEFEVFSNPEQVTVISRFDQLLDIMKDFLKFDYSQIR